MKVYLAGPMTNCNERQRKEWRYRLSQTLKHYGYHVLDPTKTDARKGALAVSADIEEADVVIANLWRESIGTVLGVVHARRCGIPVILIDQHYIDSPLLNSIVEHLVRDEDAAVNKLRNEVGPALSRELVVIKRKNREQAFDIRKLQKSLKAAIAQAGIDDPLVHILISRRVYRAILHQADLTRITTSDIKGAVFLEFRNFCLEDHGLGEKAPLMRLAANLQVAWEEHEALIKGPAREEAAESKLLLLIESLTDQLLEVERERNDLKEVVSLGISSRPNAQLAPLPRSRSESIAELFNGRRGLCISSKGRSSFKSAFDRAGIDGTMFDGLFTEKSLDGKQSNLNSDLEGYLSAYSYVLYAFNGLRHISNSETKHDPRLVTGSDPSTVTRHFLNKMLPQI